MLLTLFIVFIGLSLLLVFLGYYSKESLFSIIGWSFIFFLSIGILIPGNLEYKTGTNEAYTYMCYECIGNSIPGMATDNSTITLSSIIITDQLAKYDGTSSRFFGIWLMFTSIAGIAISLSEVQSAFSGKKDWKSN
jgi:hypothetical protein